MKTGERGSAKKQKLRRVVRKKEIVNAKRKRLSETDAQLRQMEEKSKMNSLKNIANSPKGRAAYDAEDEDPDKYYANTKSESLPLGGAAIQSENMENGSGSAQSSSVTATGQRSKGSLTEKSTSEDGDTNSNFAVPVMEVHSPQKIKELEERQRSKDDADANGNVDVSNSKK